MGEFPPFIHTFANSLFIMAKVTFRLSSKPKTTDGISRYEVLARLHTGNTDLYGKTGIFIPKEYTDNNGNKKMFWQDGKITIPRLSFADEVQMTIRQELTDAKASLSQLECKITDAWDDATTKNATIGRSWLQQVIDGGKSDNDKPNKEETLVEAFSRFIDSEPMQKLSSQCLNHYKVMRDILARYEVMNGVVLTFDALTADELRRIDKYARDEHKIFDKDRRDKRLQVQAMEVSGTKRHPQQRGDNAMIVLFKKFRAFVRWANGLDKDYLIEPLTHNNPFDRYAIKAERYGTPFYLTIRERNKIYNADLPPRLARQRDIFIFQSFVGCRVSDLWSRTKKDIIDGALEYIPRKTKDGRPITVRVPLTDTAKEILERYKDCSGDKLLPFIAQQQYNEDIKEILRLCGIDRMVTILNPLTGDEEKKPIYEVASSHMARRTFVGNIYKQVKDPNLVCKLSGHKEGSKAFARYRDIDDDMAKELVSLLE